MQLAGWRAVKRDVDGLSGKTRIGCLLNLRVGSGRLNFGSEIDDLHLDFFKKTSIALKQKISCDFFFPNRNIPFDDVARRSQRREAGN